ncbi:MULTISPECIES: hypothetical protein [unclassified Lysobacter]|uniref:hypothetical protein n=1 Tax=unclassified Lysobacter TaxID=2635362 RepID=UPI001BEB2EF0|nr:MULTISPECIES: hypothetical protein [unclassified Lysobacter]MBT2748258.1 hypothetical protein [Lysobacter sp. ISL-42]MBT2749975.1 hypothetical protein [Lysobacter sp. ISL-50]MBT2781303.1 hypothetical protein [Lysobacter sp. ISL-52]
MSTWNNFNDAENPAFALIPKGTLVKVRMTIRPGGYNDANQGWLHGWATRGDSGSVYLNGEFVVMEGKYAKRKLWSNIGLYSAKGPTWSQMGRSFIKGALNSALGLHPDDMGATAQAGRCIASFGDLDGLTFAAQVDWEKDGYGQDKAVIKMPIMPDHPQYKEVMGAVPVAAGVGAAHTAAVPAHVAHAAQTPAAAPPVAGRPAWAQ